MFEEPIASAFTFDSFPLPKIDALEQDMASSDIILVTDGELPNPPVSKEIMVKLERLREQAGVEIHGLLVGKKESTSLSSICTSVHDFLVDYELISHKFQPKMTLEEQRTSSSTALSAAFSSENAVFNCPQHGKGAIESKNDSIPLRCQELRV
jgi:hypothetical protein